MLHSVYGPKPVRFGQDWVVPGLRMHNFQAGPTTNPNRKVERLQQASDRKLAMMQGQPAAPDQAQKNQADRKQLMAALGNFLSQQNKGPATPGSTLAKNLDFSKPFQ